MKQSPSKRSLFIPIPAPLPSPGAQTRSFSNSISLHSSGTPSPRGVTGRFGSISFPFPLPDTPPSSSTTSTFFGEVAREVTGLRPARGRKAAKELAGREKDKGKRRRLSDEAKEKVASLVGLGKGWRSRGAKRRLTLILLVLGLVWWWATSTPSDKATDDDDDDDVEHRRIEEGVPQDWGEHHGQLEVRLVSPPAAVILPLPDSRPPPSSPIEQPSLASTTEESQQEEDDDFYLPEWTIPKSKVVDLDAPGAWPVPERLDSEERYLSFLPHSGFHNQRLSMINGLVLAKLLNRTLLVPPITLGAAVAWTPSPTLQSALDLSSSVDIHACRKMWRKKRKVRCGLFWKSRRASWAWLLGPERVEQRQSVIARPDFRRQWFFDVPGKGGKKGGLGLKEEEVWTVEDKSRRAFSVSDLQDGERLEQEEERRKSDMYPYEENWTVEQLRQLDKYRLLELGSLFGGTRLRIHSPLNKAYMEETKRLMAYRNPMLHTMASKVVAKLGGPQRFFSAHLRIGGNGEFADGGAGFAEAAQQRSEEVFLSLLTKPYGLSSRVAKSLLATAIAMSSTEETSRLASGPTGELRCPGKLFAKGTPLEVLNTPLYIATDGSQPRTNPRLALFRSTFPCAFFLSDFQTRSSIHPSYIPELRWLDKAVDKEGERMRPYLEPFLEGIVAGMGKEVVGTPTSTFSMFVQTVLHDAYLPKEVREEEKRRKRERKLLAQGGAQV